MAVEVAQEEGAACSPLHVKPQNFAATTAHFSQWRTEPTLRPQETMYCFKQSLATMREQPSPLVGSVSGFVGLATNRAAVRSQHVCKPFSAATRVSSVVCGVLLGFFTSSFKLFLLHSFSNVVALARLTAGVVSPVPISMPSPPRLYLPPRTPVASIVEHAMAHYAHCGVPELGDFFQCFVRVSGLCMDQTYQEYVADRMLSGSPIQTYSHEWECKFLRQLSSFTCAWSDLWLLRVQAALPTARMTTRVHSRPTLETSWARPTMRRRHPDVFHLI